MPSMTDRMEWNDLAVILAIGRSESLSGAARQLGHTHSTVFRKINDIEDRAGVRFFDRFRHGYMPTDAGRAAMVYAERIEGEVHAFGLEVLGKDSELIGRIRLTSPEAMAEDILPGVIARFHADHPGIQIDLTPGTPALDFSRREAEVAVRATRKPPDATFGRAVCDFRFALYASPAYLARAGDRPLAEQDWCLIEGSVGWLVPLVFRSAEEGVARAVFQSRASRAVLNGCAEGLGLGFLPCYVGDADDRLLRVSDTIAHLDMRLWVLTHPDLQKTSRVRALMTRLFSELRQHSALFAGQTKPVSDTRFDLGR
ncbi:LysR family transcriptional regulator [Actibacterium sp. XHP0104]|uniref:LysR family transcriptional regulator n=1 Tax=Actibacterium sp. XHP0104 TaxID=2984335 RepID=UPI0021E901B8|nr:LysR family transcriptional regulator [Actibacterium sp. XHP0104]MCV2882405.1 LysR family transcriptional regulator [Actibacterium sp. XHP0104]